MYSNKGFAILGWFAYLAIFKRDNCIKGPPGSVNIDAVPSLDIQDIFFFIKRNIITVSVYKGNVNFYNIIIFKCILIF